MGQDVQSWPVGQATDRARRFVLDAVRGWGAYVTTEGHWLRHVETLRPGMQAALFAQVEQALDRVEVRPMPNVSRPT
jgi:hypothetical protein